MPSFILDRKNRASLHQQIYDQIKKQILTGELPAGEKLPSYRFMLQKYNVQISTLERAYEKLEERGYIERRQGSGCYVRAQDYSKFFADDIVLDSFKDGQAQRPQVINFSTSTPIPNKRTSQIFSEITQQLLLQNSDVLYRYAPTKGSLSLIDALCRYLAGKNIPAEPKDIHIINGLQQGIDLLCKAFINNHTRVLVDNPSYGVVVNCFLRQGAQIFRVPMLPDGPDLDAMEALLHTTDIDYYYTMSNYQCPTNVCWCEEKRRRLLKLAKTHSFTVIEDDCLGELYYGKQPPVPLKAYDEENAVIYLNSFSKSLVAGFRLGYMLVPARFSRRILAAKFTADIACPSLLQELLAVYIANGSYEEELVCLRKAYKRKRTLMHSAIANSTNMQLTVPEENGGVFFWLRLPETVDSYLLYEQLRKQGIRIIPSKVFCEPGTYENYIRLSFSACSSSDIKEGILCIDELITYLQTQSNS